MSSQMFWDQLLQLIAEGNVVPVIGRDLLDVEFEGRRQNLYPLLAQRLADYLGVPASELTPGSEINSVVCRYIEKGNRVEDIYPALKVVMPPAEALGVPDSLAKLASIPCFKLYVTTTFDCLMEQALNEVRFAGQARSQVLSYAPNAVADLPAPANELERPTVYHLFGKLSAIPAYAVTQEDTLEFIHSLQSEARQPQVLFDELNRANLLMLGCGYGGWLARFFLRTAKRQRLLEARGSTDYIADASIGSDSSLVMFLRHYSTRTRIYESGDANQFLDQLYRRWHERFPQQSQQPEPLPDAVKEIEAGAVFLSYASEDRDAVLKIRDALEASGVDVFFDKDELKAGDDFESKLMRSIARCSLFIPIISRHTLTEERRFFRLEWLQAQEEARKAMPSQTFIVPVVIDATSPDETAIPEKFRQLHWQQLSDGDTSSEFIDDIRQHYRRYQKSMAGSP